MPMYAHPARWLFGFYVFCSRSFSHLLSRILLHIFSLLHTLSHIFYLDTLSRTFRCTFRFAFRILRHISFPLHTLSNIFYPAYSITYIPFHISHLHLHFPFCISLFRFAFAFSVSHFAFRISHQTTHIQWVSHFILLFRICNLHIESYNTSIGMSHSNPEQFAATAMQSARSRLLELPNEASI